MNSNIFISGGSKGIGLAIAIEFAKDPTNTIIIASRNPKNLTSAQTQIITETKNQKVHIYQTNFLNLPEITLLYQKISSKFKKIDILINNVGLSLHFGKTLKTSLKNYKKMLNGNLLSHFFTTQTFLPIIPKNQKSSIIFISSYVGKNPIPQIGIYSVSKSALISLSNVLSKELIDEGIRVNCIGPGVIKTEFSRLLWDSGMKVGKPSDVGSMVRFLCSEEGRFVNGAYIPVVGEALPCL